MQEAQQLAARAVRLCAEASRWFPRAKRDMLALLQAEVQCRSGDAQVRVLHRAERRARARRRSG